MGKGLSPEQERLLGFLKDKGGPVEFGVIDEAVGLSTPGNTLRALRALQRRGFAHPVQGEPLYRLSKRGRQLMDHQWRTSGKMPARLKEILEGITD